VNEQTGPDAAGSLFDSYAGEERPSCSTPCRDHVVVAITRLA
jgi:hypothetical protein